MNDLDHLLQQTYLGNSTTEWLIAGIVTLIVLFALMLVRRLIRSHYRRLLATPHAEFLELPLQVASRTTLLFIAIAALFTGVLTLELPPKLYTLALTIVTIGSFWQAGLWATTAVLASLERKRSRTISTDRATASSLGIISFIARTVIWAFVLLLTLSNLGIKIQPLLAGLGIGGIAVALAAQNILGDLFASLSITLDRPFVVGDALTVDDITGTVEYIGVKSTRLRSVSGEQIIITNSNLLASRIRNHARLRERRVLLNFGLAPETTRQQLQKIPSILRSLIEAQADTRFDRAHFARISPTSFDFEAVYFVTTPDFNRHMDIQQAVQLGLIEALEKESIGLAYPAQTLVLKKDDAFAAKG